MNGVSSTVKLHKHKHIHERRLDDDDAEIHKLRRSLEPNATKSAQKNEKTKSTEFCTKQNKKKTKH